MRQSKIFFLIHGFYKENQYFLIKFTEKSLFLLQDQRVLPLISQLDQREYPLVLERKQLFLLGFSWFFYIFEATEGMGKLRKSMKDNCFSLQDQRVPPLNWSWAFGGEICQTAMIKHFAKLDNDARTPKVTTGTGHNTLLPVFSIPASPIHLAT